jgi:hypothetical protein
VGTGTGLEILETKNLYYLQDTSLKAEVGLPNWNKKLPLSLHRSLLFEILMLFQE